VNLQHLTSERGEMRIGADDPRIHALRQMATEPICDVRAITEAVADADLARLATSVVVTEVPAGQCSNQFAGTNSVPIRSLSRKKTAVTPSKELILRSG
jgi:hypothetical protein